MFIIFEKMNDERSSGGEGLFGEAGCGDVRQRKDACELHPDARTAREAEEMMDDRGARQGACGDRDFRRRDDRWQTGSQQLEDHGMRVPEQLVGNKRPKVMPDQYDGRGSWADYIAHFEICCEINGWTPQQRAQYLSVSLRGSACQVLGTLPQGRRRDYRELVTALGRRFNPENQSELYRVQLRNRGRKVNESLPELGQQIRTLVAQAYPGANPKVLEVLGRDYFIDAIDDPDIRWRIYQAKPDNLDGAICTAIEFEAYKSAEKQRIGGKRFV